MATSFFPEGLSPLTRYNAAQRGTHIRRRNRKRSDGVVAVVRPAAAVIRVLATSSSFDNPFGSDCALAGLFRVMASLRVCLLNHIICIAQIGIVAFVTAITLWSIFQ